MENRGRGHDLNHRDRGKNGEYHGPRRYKDDGRRRIAGKYSNQNEFGGEKEKQSFSNDTQGGMKSTHERETSSHYADKPSDTAREDNDNEGFHQVRHGKGRHYDHVH